MINLSTLACQEGDIVIRINDDDPDERKKLARNVNSLLKKGALVVITTKDKKDLRVSGYDPKTNEWILHSSSASQEPVQEKRKRGRPRKVHAQGSSATVVAPIAGG